MSELFNKIKEYLSKNKIDGFFFNSSNEFLMEYNVLELNSAFKLTNFLGSTSMGIAANDKVYLFVDTRYHAQADIEVKDEFIEIVKVPLTQSLFSALFEVLPEKFKLGIPTKKVSKLLYDMFRKEGRKKRIKIVPFSDDAIEICDGSYIPDKDYEIFKIPLNISGKSADEKISDLFTNYENAHLIITDLADIAYFTNLRSFDFPFSSTFPAKLIVNPDGAVLYVNSEKRFNSTFIQTKYFPQFYEDLVKIKGEKIYYQKSAISMYDYSLIDKSNEIYDCDISIKSVKNETEIKHFQDSFFRSDSALEIIEDMLNSDNEYSEHEFSNALIDSLYSNGAYSLSFKPIVACGSNSAIIHYSTPSKDKYVKDGDFLLIDFGAYFDGGYATDTTRTFIKGQPSQEQKRVYTTVLKAFLNAYYRPSKKYFDIDKKAREIIDKELGDDYPFAHGTGHGVGINVHEVPPRVSNHKISKVDLIENTVFSIEPGAYKLGFGGVRLENTVYAKNIDGKIRPQTLSKYKFEDKLVDKSLLSPKELKWYNQWQAEYERTYLSK